MSGSEEEVCMVQDLLALTEAASIFEQIPLVAVGKMRGVDWTIITVSPPCHLLPTLHCTRQRLSQLKVLVPYGLPLAAFLCTNLQYRPQLKMLVTFCP